MQVRRMRELLLRLHVRISCGWMCQAWFSFVSCGICIDQLYLAREFFGDTPPLVDSNGIQEGKRTTCSEASISKAPKSPIPTPLNSVQPRSRSAKLNPTQPSVKTKPTPKTKLAATTATLNDAANQSNHETGDDGTSSEDDVGKDDDNVIVVEYQIVPEHGDSGRSGKKSTKKAKNASLPLGEGGQEASQEQQGL
jgi:hypothetical protein